MSIFTGMNVAATGMTAQQVRLDTIAENIANASTTRTEDGTPYRRKMVTFKDQGTLSGFDQILFNKLNTYTPTGVKVAGIHEDQSDFKLVYDPDHPDADENGYVSYPNVDTVTEMTNMIDASRSYEANVTSFNASKSMAMKGLELMKN